MTKRDFYDFANLMIEDSKLLHDKESIHNSVYLAGYSLEAYIKIILLHHDENAFKGHLGDSEFLSKFRRLITLHPDFFSNSILVEGNVNYPKYLFNGQGNNTTKVNWNINSRYKVTHWTDTNFSNNVQNELDKINGALAILRIDGVIG